MANVITEEDVIAANKEEAAIAKDGKKAAKVRTRESRYFEVEELVAPTLKKMINSLLRLQRDTRFNVDRIKEIRLEPTHDGGVNVRWMDTIQGSAYTHYRGEELL